MPLSAIDNHFEQAEQAAATVRERTLLQPKIAIVLGTGLGGFADQLAGQVAIPYGEIPHFPRPTVEGHKGRLVLGSFAGTPLAVMQGRVHAYEGYTPEQIIFPVRMLARLGVRVLIVTNAAGGIRTDYAPGELVLISDHIMSDAYSTRLRLLAQKAAEAEGRRLAEGVYLGLTGPSFETPAEIRALRALGADLVGMSTVFEVIAACHLGMEVLGFSCVTNMAAGVLAEPINHAEVMEISARAQLELARLLAGVVPHIAEQMA
jgi:purine-nucleoside phosphorylase